MASIMKMAPIMDNGMATTGMMTERTEPRKRKMTTMTMIKASTKALITSSMAAVMYSEAS